MPEDSTETKDHLLSNRLYDRLKLIVLIFLPAVGTFYASIAAIWGLPYAQEVLSTTAATAVLLGALIKVGDSTYNKSEAKYDGELLFDASGNAKRVVQNGPIADDREDILLKVVTPERAIAGEVEALDNGAPWGPAN